MRKIFIITSATIALFVAHSVHAQTANGRATASAPTYGEGQASPLSLDTAGNMRVNCVTGCSAPATQDVNVKSVGGNDVTTTVPVSGSVSATVSGNVGITGALPAGSNAIGTVGVTALPSLPAGSNTIGGVNVISSPGLTDTQLRATPVPVEISLAAATVFTANNAVITAQVISANPGSLRYIYTVSSTATTFTLYDNASACTGTILLQATTGASYVNAMQMNPLPYAIPFANGLTYCSSAATTRNVVAVYN